LGYWLIPQRYELWDCNGCFSKIREANSSIQEENDLKSHFILMQASQSNKEWKEESV
jgi:hypothetical protein